MHKNYLTDKALKRNYALKGVWLVVAFAIIFVIVVTRFAIAGYNFGLNNGLPGSEDAYAIAKTFVKPTIGLKGITFPESGYQCATKPDSVYIIKSYAEAQNQSADKNVITFEVAMKYKGGKPSDKDSWTLLGIKKN